MRLSLMMRNLFSSSKVISSIIITLTFIVTLTLVSTLPSPSAIAQGIITPSPSPEVSSEVTPEVTGETTSVDTTSVTPEVTPKADIKAKREFKTDINFSVKARELVEKKTGVSKDKLKIAKEREVNFGFSGKRARSFKFIDDMGKISGLTLDEDGEETNVETLVAEDLKARKVRYGKFDPGFFEKLAKEPEDKPVQAVLTLKVPYYTPLPRPAFRLPDDGSNPSQDEINKINKKEQEVYNAHIQPLMDSVAEKLKTKAYRIKEPYTPGLISVELSPRQLKEVQEWDEIDGISDGSLKDQSLLASARPASGISAVNSRTINGIGVNGTGVNVAEIEQGGRVSLDPIKTPDLPATNIVQDPTVCSFISDHATLIAGILKSTNLSNSGISPGISLWVSGDCDGDKDIMYNRAYEAVSNHGSNIVNISAGCTGEGVSCHRYPEYEVAGWYDGLAYYSTHPTIIVAAGNNWGGSGDWTGNIYSSGVGYNVLSIGSYDDKNNNDPYDDSMSSFSSWKNPTDIYNNNIDREKPDVVAPGRDVRSTGYSSTLIEDFGTSFSAPIVTGGSALLMQRASVLKNEPEALKALILVTARNDVARDGQMPSGDSKDGYGGVDFDWADKLLQGQTGGSVFFGDYRCETTPDPLIIPMNISTTQPYRAIFTWRITPYAPNYSSMPNIDLDIMIKDPNGSQVGGSASYNNNTEGVYFTPTITGTYTMNIGRFRCDDPYTYTRYAAGWTPVPTYLAEYYNNKTLSGTPVLRRYDDFINNNWGYGSPGAGVNSDNFSARFTKTDHFNAGTYEFGVISDDGIRLYVDNVKILDRWFDQGPSSTPYKVQRALTGGNHTIKLEYYESGAGAEVHFNYEKINPIVSNGVYRLVNQCSGKVLDVSGGSTANGANVQQWGWANPPVNQQKWKITSLSGGYYRLTPQHSTNKALQVAGSSPDDGGNVNQGTWSSGNNQQWIISNAGADFSKLVAKHSSKALDLYGGYLNDGANIDQWFVNNTCAQKWRLDKL